MSPVLERQDNPWESVLLLNPSRKRRNGGRKVAKKRSRKGRRRGRKGRRLTIPVTVQGGGLLAVGRRRRIKGIRMVGRNALGRFRKGGRKGRRRHGGRKARRHGARRGRRAGSRKGRRRVKHGVSGIAWQRAHRGTLRKRGRRLAKAGKLKERGNKPAGFEYLDNPRGGRRMARRRRRSGRRRRARRHSAVAAPRRRRRRRSSRRRGRRSARRGRVSRRRRRRSSRRGRRSARRDNPRKGKRRRHGRRRGHRRSFSLLAIRRSNPLSAIKSFPFKEAAINGGLAGAGLLASRYLLGSKSPLPASVLSYIGAPGTVQNVAVRNGVLFGIGVLAYSFTRFKPAGLAMATVAVANAVGELAAMQFPTAGFSGLGLDYSTFEALQQGTANQPRSLFSGLSSDLIYGSAQPYGLAGGMGDSNFVVDSAAPYGSGMEGHEEETYA